MVLRLLTISFTFVLFLWGALGLYMVELRRVGLLIFILILIVLANIRKKLEIPKGFWIYLLFLILLSANLFWSKDRSTTLEFLILFVSGGALWLFTFNAGEKIKRDLERAIVFLGIIFGASYVVNLFFSPEVPVRAWTLYLPSSVGRNHNHLGDIWAIVLVIVSHRFLIKPKWWDWALVALGVYFLAVSLSRSAYLALGVGIFYLFNKLKVTKKYRKFYMLFMVLAAGLFLYAGLFKSTLFARPYFEQAVWGLKKWPFGVGVGNFGTMSTDSQSSWWAARGTGVFSSSAHNIILELLAGMGVFGFVFVAWLAYILLDVFKNRNRQGLVFAASFLAIAVNFMFDTTYFIPTMLWLWFMSLGLSQKQKSQTVQHKI